MAEQTAKQPSAARGAGLTAGASFHPRLGDLAHDLARGKVGVVVAVPSETSASYHLRPPGGGSEWTAKSNGTTLRPVAVGVTHVVPQRQDAVYDHRAQHVSLPVTVHYEDGGASESVLILSPSHVEQYYTQLGRLIERRKQARERNK